MAINVTDQLTTINEKVNSADIPTGLREDILTRTSQLTNLVESSTFLPEFDRLVSYVEWVVSLPWNKKSQDVLDLVRAKEILDSNHYGLDEIKERVLEYMSVMKLNTENKENIAHAPILCFVGLVGTGKTTIAKSIADAMGRKFVRIPFGGMGDPLDLRGQSRMHPEAEPGKVIKAVKLAGTRNPVILLDEIDRVTDEGKSSIMGVLVELLDPQQNYAFVDHYIDYPFDLSEALFIATANNTLRISTAVLDRLEPIMMPSYTDNEKMVIGQKYIFPKVMKESGVPENALTIQEDVWPSLVRPLGFDGGIRTLQRTIEGVVRKAAKEVVEGKTDRIVITKDNVKDYLPQL
ncbi:MAG: hypothetical protein ACD_52C00217G0002 [uncultured bacterium]|nr:MAG: hypothetical protein ACD_52C00217G0002 [uncultured bacterium]